MQHSKCLFCVHQCSQQVPLAPTSVRGSEQQTGGRDIGRDGSAKAGASLPDVPLAAPSAAQIFAAPMGTIRHRIYRCPRLEPLRATIAPQEMVKKELAYPVADTDLALERALFPVPFKRVPAPASKASFH